MNDSILTELRRPFPPSVVIWKPGAVNADKTRALGLAYADLRAYQNRLDEVCGMQWSISYTPWGDRIICNLTIAGVTRSSTGEADAQSERSEIAGTAAEAQAFKRAAAMFGLGRYLYNLPSLWVDYDASKRTFSDAGRAKLEAIVTNHYRANTGQAVVAEPEPASDDQLVTLLAQFHALGTQIYGETWEQVRHHNVERITNGASSSSNDLTADQVQKLIDGLKSLQRKRQAAQQRTGQRVAA